MNLNQTSEAAISEKVKESVEKTSVSLSKGSAKIDVESFMDYSARFSQKEGKTIDDYRRFREDLTYMIYALGGFVEIREHLKEVHRSVSTILSLVDDHQNTKEKKEQK